MGSTGRTLLFRASQPLWTTCPNRSTRWSLSSPRLCESQRLNGSAAHRSLATERQLPADFYRTCETRSSSLEAVASTARSEYSFEQHHHGRIPSDHKPPNPRQLQLGRTIRTLHDSLPDILQSPLPQSILSPQITLRLFPSTHPHLPTVSGRLTYVAALWTAPVAWGRIPVIGDVKLVILSERMYGSGGDGGGERLIVRWRTLEGEEGKGERQAAGADDRNLFATIWSRAGQTLQPGKSLDDASKGLPVSSRSPRSQAWDTRRDTPETAFTGLFIFEFDEEGRLHTHTIEHAEEGGNWEQTTSRVISVTDWLLGRAWGRSQEDAGLALGYARTDTKPSSPAEALRRLRKRGPC